MGNNVMINNPMFLMGVSTAAVAALVIIEIIRKK
jgi:hypothetical protein